MHPGGVARSISARSSIAGPSAGISAVVQDHRAVAPRNTAPVPLPMPRLQRRPQFFGLGLDTLRPVQRGLGAGLLLGGCVGTRVSRHVVPAPKPARVAAGPADLAISSDMAPLTDRAQLAVSGVQPVSSLSTCAVIAWVDRSGALCLHRDRGVTAACPRVHRRRTAGTPSTAAAPRRP